MKTLLETYTSFVEREELDESHILFIGEEAGADGVGKYIPVESFKELASTTPDKGIRKLIIYFKDGKVMYRNPTGDGWQLHLPFKMPEKIDFMDKIE